MLEKEILYKIKKEIYKKEYDAYIKEGRHFNLANKFNDTMVTVDRPISIADLNSYADKNGIIIYLEDIIADDKDKYHVDVIKACRQILRIFLARYDFIDLTVSKVQECFNTLVTANVFTQEVVDEIYNLGKVQISLSEYKFNLSLLTSQDIADAINIQ